MAKIVFIAISNTSWVHPISPDSYVQGFTNALARMGNLVKSIVVNGFQQSTMDNTVISFKPDFIFTINNAGISKNILDRTDCPIVLVVSDSLPFLNNLDLVHKNKDRYYFLHTSEDSYNQINDVFPETPENRNVILGHVTDLRKKDIEQDIPISFVGSLGNWDKSFSLYWENAVNHTDFSDQYQIDLLIQKKKAFLDQQKEYLASPLDTKSSVLHNSALPDFDTITGFRYTRAVVYLHTCNRRFAVLEQLMDLGLKIYSYPRGMVDVVRYNLKMFECFDFTPSVTLADSERTFNRSKISMNLPHAHVVKGFSWRVPDILASNACLLADYRPDLKKLMTGYIDMPMYQSPAEARELAQKLLKDDVWRKEIVAASQQMIEDKCRFEHRLRKVAEKTGLKLEYPEEKGWQELIRKVIPKIEYKAEVPVSAPCSSFTENVFRSIFKLMTFLVFTHKKRKYLIQRFSLKRITIPENRKLNLKNKIRYKVWKHLNKKNSLFPMEYRLYKHLQKKLQKKEIISQNVFFSRRGKIGKYYKNNNIEKKQEKTFYKRLIDNGGFYFSGSSSLMGLFREFDNTTVFGYSDPVYSASYSPERQSECVFLRGSALWKFIDGFYSDNKLEKDLAIKLFINDINTAYHKKGIAHEYIPEIYNEDFLKMSLDFLTSSIKLDKETSDYMRGKSFFFSFNSSTDTRYEQCCFMHGKGVKQYLFYEYRDMTAETFESYVADYIKKFLHLFSSREYLFCDGLITYNLFERLNHYLGNNPLKQIRVWRDPRDQFLSAFRHDMGVLPRNIDDYVDFYLERNGLKHLLENPGANRLMIRFEDLVLKYEETTQKILDFIGMDKSHHIAPKTVFDPALSAVNIGAYKEFIDQDFMRQIEEHLGKYCYYPEKENLSAEALKLLKAHNYG